VSDVFGRHPGDERLDAEVSAALAARVHRRSRVAVWMGRGALAASLVLVVVAAVLLVHEGASVPPEGGTRTPGIGPLLAAIAVVVTATAVVLVGTTARRTRRLFEASAPEGGVVLGLSGAGINLTHLPLLEWETVRAIGVAERRRGAAREVTVALAVPDVDAARARIIDARLVHLVRPFPRRSGLGRHRGRVAGPEAGFLAVDLSDLLDGEVVSRVIDRLEREADERGIPLHRVDDRRRLPAVLRPEGAPGG
jgi:hypothetical protein